MLEYVSLLIILSGATFLALAIYYARKLDLFSALLSKRWLLTAPLLLFFIAGYILSIALIINKSASLLVIITALVFFAGGLFAFIIVRISNVVVEKLKSINELEHEKNHIQTVQQRLRNILDHAAESIITFNNNGIIESCNRAAEDLFGYKRKEVIGRKIWLLIPECQEDFLRGLTKKIGKSLELLALTRQGDNFPISFKVSNVIINGKRIFTAIMSDISERKAMINRLQELADHDDLTNLYNRRYFQQRLQEALGLMQRDVYSCALLYIDLDHFKIVNDTFGHAGGDRLLIKIANLLQKQSRKTDCIARVGGDEFVVLLYNVDKKTSLKIADNLRHSLATRAFRYANTTVDVGCSIGVLPLDKSYTTAEEALSHTDLACYLAKKSGRNQVQLFDLPEDNLTD